MLFTGVPCDVSIGGGNARFKAEVVKVLAGMDARFGAMVRIVKLWAGQRGLNDAMSGTFNSFALSLMVSTPHSSLLQYIRDRKSHGKQDNPKP